MYFRKPAVLGALMCLALAPAPARADWLLSPYLGTTFGSELTDSENTDNEFANKLNYGVALTFMGGGIIGFEIDFAYAPEFFEANDEDLDFLDDSNLTTIMANLVVGAPIGGQTGPGFRPYAAGGIGLMRANLESAGDLFDDISDNSFGINVGGGVIGFLSNNIGLRGDLRYFQSLSDIGDNLDFDLGKFRYWRGTGGIVFRF